jgi:hypothetical protein
MEVRMDFDHMFRIIYVDGIGGAALESALTLDDAMRTAEEDAERRSPHWPGGQLEWFASEPPTDTILSEPTLDHDEGYYQVVFPSKGRSPACADCGCPKTDGHCDFCAREEDDSADICGDCGTLTYIHKFERVCPYCNTRTRLA